MPRRRRSCTTAERAALDAIVAEMLLIAQAAKEKNMTAEAYERRNWQARTKPVTDADVVAFYQANINQMQGRSLEVMAPAINRYLTEQQRDAARASLIAELRKAGPEVRVLFDAPRHTIEVDRRRSVARPRIGAGDAHRVLGLPVPVLPARRADAQAGEADSYGDKVRIVWKDFPLTQIHPQAFKAGEAAHCAGEQGKFWEYHDRLFANQQLLQPNDLKKHAADLGLDAEGVQFLPRLVEVRRARARRRRRGLAPWRELDADDLHQRPRRSPARSRTKRSPASSTRSFPSRSEHRPHRAREHPRARDT